jgi:hypothetical protein
LRSLPWDELPLTGKRIAALKAAVERNPALERSDPADYTTPADHRGVFTFAMQASTGSPHCLGRDAADLIGLSRNAANSRGGPHMTSKV